MGDFKAFGSQRLNKRVFEYNWQGCMGENEKEWGKQEDKKNQTYIPKQVNSSTFYK